MAVFEGFVFNWESVQCGRHERRLSILYTPFLVRAHMRPKKTSAAVTQKTDFPFECVYFRCERSDGTLIPCHGGPWKFRDDGKGGDWMDEIWPRNASRLSNEYV